MNKKIFLLSFSIVAFLLLGCKKKETTAPATTGTTAGTVLSSEANVVISPTYITLANDASLLYTGAMAFQSTPTQSNLLACRQLWLNASADYEVSSATEFGPNSAIGTDPGSAINTFPVDTFEIDTLANGPLLSQHIEDSLVSILPSYLTGFHGIEFELYGINGTKTAGQFTPGQLAYITAVALDIKNITWQLDSEWSPNYSYLGNYYYQFVNAGSGSTVYPDQRAAFADLVFAIANITETDGIYKLNGIFANKSTILQESPFANNSITDIENNLTGVHNIYYGQYGGNAGIGLTVFVSQNNVSLDQKIKNDLSAAQKAVSLITLPLSQAIYSQSPQMQLALNTCDSLDDDLKTGLLLYMNTNTN